MIGFYFNQWKMFDMAGTNLRNDLDIEEMGSSWGSNSVCILSIVKLNATICFKHASCQPFHFQQSMLDLTCVVCVETI